MAELAVSIIVREEQPQSGPACVTGVSEHQDVAV
jgi:hypothetical protein